MKSYLYLTKEFKQKSNYLPSVKDNSTEVIINYKRSLVDIHNYRSINNIHTNYTFKSLDFNVVKSYLQRLEGANTTKKLKARQNLLSLLFGQSYSSINQKELEYYLPLIKILTTFQPYYRNNMISLKDVLFLSQYQNFSLIDKRLLSNFQFFFYFLLSRKINKNFFLNKKKIKYKTKFKKKLWLRPLDTVFYSVWTYKSLTLRMKDKWFLSPDKIYSHTNKSRSFYLHFVHTLLKDGKKHLAEKLMDDSFFYIKKHTSRNPFKVLKRSVLNNRISVRIRSFRKSGRNILVPVAIKLLRQYSFAIKRMVEVCNERREYSYSHRLAKEIMDSYLNKGLAIRKRNDYYRLVNANKINVYFKFGK